MKANTVTIVISLTDLDGRPGGISTQQFTIPAPGLQTPDLSPRANKAMRAAARSLGVIIPPFKDPIGVRDPLHQRKGTRAN